MGSTMHYVLGLAGLELCRRVTPRSRHSCHFSVTESVMGFALDSQGRLTALGNLGSSKFPFPAK